MRRRAAAISSSLSPLCQASCPSTRRGSAAKADSHCSGARSAKRSKLPRRVLPSRATSRLCGGAASAASPSASHARRRNACSMASWSSPSRISRSPVWLGAWRQRNCVCSRSHSSRASMKRTIARYESAPAATARMQHSTTCGRSYIRPCPRRASTMPSRSANFSMPVSKSSKRADCQR